MAVPELLVVLLDVSLVVLLLVAVLVSLMTLLFVVVELGLEGIMLEGIFGGHLL